MGSTFLSLTNRVLAHFNEVQLTSSNFATATGFNQVAKDAVLDSIRQVQQAEYEWPFNHQETTQTLTPTGSISGHTVAYALPTGTTSFETIDWESFVLVRDDTLLNADASGTLPVSTKKLPYKEYDEYMQRYRDNDLNILFTDTSTREPNFITRDQNSNFIVSPPPDRAYQVKFEWWGYETDLSAYSDTTSIPSRFDHVIHKGALSLCYDFRGDAVRSNMYNKRHMDGIAKMRELLINRERKLRDKRVNNRAG